MNTLFYILINTNHDCFAKGIISNNDTGNSFKDISKHTQFEGPSPDEIALLKGSKNHCGFLLKGADSRICTVMDSNNKNFLIEKIFLFKFDSNRKMMSMIIKFEDKFFLMTKGADTSIESRSIYKP